MMNQTLFRQTCTAVLAMSAILPAAGSAAETQVLITDHPVERRLVIAITMPASGDVARTVRLPGGFMVHRFSIAQTSTAISGVGVVIVAFGGNGTAHLAHLSGRQPALDLPRPLGFLLTDGDSLRIEIRGIDQASPIDELHIVLHYDRIERPRSRLAVIPVRAASTSPEGAATQSWEWIAPVSGRVMSVAGLTPRGTGELLLVDVETGTVLWRETVQPADGEAFACASGVVRAGAQVLVGRRYRLVAVGHGHGVLESTGLVQALLLPG